MSLSRHPIRVHPTQLYAVALPHAVLSTVGRQHEESGLAQKVQGGTPKVWPPNQVRKLKDPYIRTLESERDQRCLE